MATATSSVQGSSTAIPSLQRGLGTNFGLNQADSKSQLFESLLSLPLFEAKESSINDSDTLNSSPVSDSIGNESSESAQASDVEKDQKESETDEGSDSASNYSTNPLLVPVAPITTPTELKTPTSQKPTETPKVVADQVYDPDNTILGKNPIDSSLEKVANVKNNDLANGKEPQFDPLASSVESQKATDSSKSASIDDTNVIPVEQETDEAAFKIQIEGEASEIQSDKGGKSVKDRVETNDNKVLANPIVTGDEAQSLPVESSQQQESSSELDISDSAKEDDEADSSLKPVAGRRAERLQETRRDSRFQDDRQFNSDADDKSSNPVSENTYSTGSPEIVVDPLVSNSQVIQASFTGQTELLSFANAEISTSVTQNVLVASAAANLNSGTASATATAAVNAATATSTANSNSQPIALSATAGINGPQTSVSATTSTYGGTGNGGGGSTTTTGLTKYQEQRVLQRALKGMEQLQDGTSPIRVRLHPPELGSLQVTVRVDLNQVIAAIEVEHSAAKQVLLENLPKLQASLKDQGITIADFRVEVVAPGEFSGAQNSSGFNAQQGQSRDGSTSSNSRYATMARNRIDEVAAPAMASGSVAWSRKDGNLDVNV